MERDGRENNKSTQEYCENQVNHFKAYLDTLRLFSVDIVWDYRTYRWNKYDQFVVLPV